MKPVTLIGTGNVAWQLGSAFRQVGITITQVYGRSATKTFELAHHLGATPIQSWQDLSHLDGIVILCVKDDAIAQVASSFLDTPRLLVHTSGSVSMHVMAGKAQHIGVFYPLQSLHRNRSINWSEIPICIEASSPEALNEVGWLATLISDKVVQLSSDERRWLHLAAVLVSNFTNFLYMQAASLCNAHGLSFELLQPLIIETARRLEISSPNDWQTGPARRNDVQVMNQHMDLLKNNPDLQKLYSQFSEYIVRYYHADFS